MFLFVTSRGQCDWHLLHRGQRLLALCNAQDSTVHKNPIIFTTKNYLAPNVNSAKVRSPDLYFWPCITISLHVCLLVLPWQEDVLFIFPEIFLAHSTCSMSVFEWMEEKGKKRRKGWEGEKKTTRGDANPGRGEGREKEFSHFSRKLPGMMQAACPYPQYIPEGILNPVFKARQTKDVGFLPRIS